MNRYLRRRRLNRRSTVETSAFIQGTVQGILMFGIIVRIDVDPRDEKLGDLIIDFVDIDHRTDGGLSLLLLLLLLFGEIGDEISRCVEIT